VFGDVGDAEFGYFGEDESSLELLDPDTLLPDWWDGCGLDLTKADRRALGLSGLRWKGRDGSRPQWPGLAPPGTPGTHPDWLAEEVAEAKLAHTTSARLALVPASRSADSLGLAGWTPTDDEAHHAGALSAVVRSWEDRFGARVIGVERGTLWLSVATPPRTIGHAARVAAEHFAFCPEVEPREDFGCNPDRPWFLQYAESIVDQQAWRFWWD
jgi:hypothetical protein